MVRSSKDVGGKSLPLYIDKFLINLRFCCIILKKNYIGEFRFRFRNRFFSTPLLLLNMLCFCTNESCIGF